MEYIPYYDFSTFPVNSNSLLKTIDSAAGNGFNTIIIDFGEYFPWTIDNFRRSNLAYSEKLIEKIVHNCKENEVIIIPVLSILGKSDFIFEGDKYKYLRNDGIEGRGLNIQSCGVNKLVEDLHDDIFNLLVNSDYLLLELPEFYKQEKSNIASREIKTFIKRVAANLDESGKQLILGWNKEAESEFDLGKINYIPKYLEKKINIYTSISYNLDIYESRIRIKNIDYTISKLQGTDDFISGEDVGHQILNFIEDNKYTTNKILISTQQFFSQLDAVWNQIRICWEDLSYIYRNTDSYYRIKFCRSVSLLNKNYKKLKPSVFIILDYFEVFYLPNILRNWMNSKLDSIMGQLRNLEDIASPMSDGY